MNPPTIHKKSASDCPEICEHLADSISAFSLQKSQNFTYPAYTSPERHTMIDKYGHHLIYHNTTLVAKSGSISSVCPHDEKLWLLRNHRRDILSGMFRLGVKILELKVLGKIVKNIALDYNLVNRFRLKIPTPSLAKIIQNTYRCQAFA